MKSNRFPTALVQAQRLASQEAKRTIPHHRVILVPVSGDTGGIYEVRFNHWSDSLWRSCVPKLTLPVYQYKEWEAWFAARSR